jgi:hypothetical protein
MVLTFIHVLHGYRQLVSWDVWSSPIMSETLILCCWDMCLRRNSRVTCQRYYLIECQRVAVLLARISPLGAGAFQSTFTCEPKSSCRTQDPWRPTYSDIKVPMSESPLMSPRGGVNRWFWNLTKLTAERTARTGQSGFVRELTTKHIQLISRHFINKSKL